MPARISKVTAVLTAVLALQGAAYYAIAARPELTPSVAPLGLFPSILPGWQMAKDEPIEKETAAILKASDLLQRYYRDQSGQIALLFIAYFQTQRTGSSPHSPKNCLPGSGYEPVESPGNERIEVPGRAAPLEVNRYIVAKDEKEQVVLYWYQSHSRVIASEFAAKFWLVADAMRYRRSDTALVRVVASVEGSNRQAALAEAVSLVQAAYPALARQLPQ